MDECVFVAVESVCARRCVRMATGKRKAGMEGIRVEIGADSLLSRVVRLGSIVKARFEQGIKSGESGHWGRISTSWRERL